LYLWRGPHAMFSLSSDQGTRTYDEMVQEVQTIARYRFVVYEQ
jgi:hypothetical protein